MGRKKMTVIDTAAAAEASAGFSKTFFLTYKSNYSIALINATGRYIGLILTKKFTILNNF